MAADENAQNELYNARDLAVINSNSSRLADIIKKAVNQIQYQVTVDMTRSNTNMKQRVLVMNGQRVLQAEGAAGKWHNIQVDKAGGLKPNIYPLYLFKEPDKSKSHDGPIVHTDKQGVFQQVGKQIVKHDLANFDKIPEVGMDKSISYNQVSGKALVNVASEK